MGKPIDEAAADAVSLHTTPGQSSTRPAYPVDDAPEISIDDLPPNYTDALQSSEAAPMLGPANDNIGPGATIRPADHDAMFVGNATTGARCWVAKSVEDPATLESYIKRLAAIPPRPYIKIVGTHQETTKDSKGKSEKNTVTDFDVSVELTPFLYSDAQYRQSWSYLRTVENSEETRRGTILRKRAPGSNQSIEVGGHPKPTLQEWCHRFAASHAGLKVFTLRRCMVGFDENYIKGRLTSLVRGSNYRGSLQIELVTRDSLIEYYNDTKVNRWRMTSWIQWLFTLTLLFIFSWPYLWLRTKRWEVAIAEWPFSRISDIGAKEYVSISEDQWYNMWGRAIHKAVMEKRQTTLDQADLRQAQQAERIFNIGNTGADETLGLFRAGIHAMNEVNRQLGWGGDC